MSVRYVNLLFVLIILVLAGCKSSQSEQTSLESTNNENETELISTTELEQDANTADESMHEIITSDGDDELVEEIAFIEDTSSEEVIPYLVTSDLSSLEKDVEHNDGQIPVQVLNNIPDLVGENIITLEDQSIILSDLLANDSDQDGDDINIIDFSRNSIQGGVLELVSVNVLKYTPAENFNGLDSFAYVVSDDQGASATAIVNITVEAINDMPQVTGEDIIVLEDESILLMGLATNDFDGDGDELVIKDFSQGENGFVKIINSNTLKYTPMPNYYGADSFTYSVSDGKGDSVIATVNIKVQEVNDVPIVQNEVVTMLEDQSILLNNLMDNDIDIDLDVLSIESIGQSENSGLIERLSDEEIRYTPPKNFSGTDSFKYEVSDSRGGKVTGTVTIVVIDVNDIPVAKVDNFQFSQGTVQEIDVLANDEGVSEDINISFISLPKSGDLEITLEGKIIYTPHSDYFGLDSFIYQVDDKDNETSVATVSLDIQCVERCNTVFELVWEPSVTESVAAYKVYYGTEASNLDQVVELKNVTKYEHFVDVKGEYFFAVSAINDKNIESDRTAIVSGIF